MKTDILGDLRDWNRVVEQLDRMKERAEAHGHQEGLSRLSNSRFNWRIRKNAVQRLSILSDPDDRIRLLLIEIVSDGNVDFELRTLAAASLCSLISSLQNRGRWTSDLKKDVIKRLSEAMNPHHPVEFRRAAACAIDCARRNERPPVAV